MAANFKSYNLKLSEKAYFKLREIELFFEKKEKRTFTKNEVLEKIITEFKIEK